ncbi:unnamed protein product [Linum tenue]|uniref:F-box domain-containing protein n=1 Tax=Linum tenue TaxID=586396 RepID=A0AAV0NJ79_9ROSI|nr:unnamed protein product [Linum tenue]
MTTRLRESTADRISNLPDGAIERILVFLPIKDAAKTSLLSRDWRHRWRSIPQLVFDDRFAPLPEEDDCGNIADDGKDVVLKIYEALLTHDGLLTKFELSIPEFRRQIPLDLLILHLSRKAVQELALLFEDDNYPKLHSSLFSPAFPLKRLKLKGSFVKDNSDMVDLFASLPALQHLNLGIELLLLDDSDEHPPSKVIGSLQKLLEAEDQLGFCCLQHLEEVNIHDSRGMQVELDLVRFVLATAPVLRRINIQRKEKLSSKKALKFLNEMIVYKRISKEAEIKYV